LGFGTIVGSAWLVVLSDWLRSAGPGGSMLAFGLGGLATASIAVCYATLARRYPYVGGEVVYALEVFGTGAAFAAGWFLTLMLIAACAFEGIAVATFVDAVAPGSLGGVLYRFAGEPVRIGAVTLGTAGALIITYMNIRGVRPAVRFQVTITASFLALVLLVLLSGASQGALRNASPLFPSQAQPWWRGAAWIVATGPFWFYGFQAVLQAVEERSAGISVFQVGWLAVISVLLAATFYIVVIACTSVAAPWMHSAQAPIAATAALRSLFGGDWLVRLMLISAILSVIKTWNGAAFMASRILLAQARDDLLPSALGHIHPKYGSPWIAIALVGALNVAGIALGRGAMLRIAETSAMCIGVLFVMVCGATLKAQALGELEQSGRVPGGYPLACFALLSAVFMAGYGVLAPLWEESNSGHVPIQWVILGSWAVLGFAFWSTRERLSHSQRGV